jgi:hypothetical protein
LSRPRGGRTSPRSRQGDRTGGHAVLAPSGRFQRLGRQNLSRRKSQARLVLSNCAQRSVSKPALSEAKGRSSRHERSRHLNHPSRRDTSPRSSG